MISSMSILRTCMNFPLNCKIKEAVLGVLSNQLFYIFILSKLTDRTVLIT